MSRSLAITRTPQKVADQSYRVTYSAVGTEMDSNIFVLKRQIVDPTQPSAATRDVYDHVATPVDLTTLYVNAPLGGAITFRVASFAKTYQTAGQASTEWQDLQTDVNLLVAALNAADQTTAPETVTLTG